VRELLVVFHEATRTGSPRVLHDLVRHVRRDLDRPLAVKILAGGPMAPQLAGLGDVDATGATPAAVLINSSLAAAEAWRYDPSTPIGIYVHEEGEALRTLPPRAVAALRERCDQVWCVSESGRQDLEELGIDPSRISVLPPVVRPPGAVGSADRDDVRRQLDLPPGTRLVAACGEANWRKGADLFLDVARRLAVDPGLGFVWIGRRPRAFARVLDHDTRSLGLQERLRWTGEVPDPTLILREADLLTVTSREDPQPLVPLEAALVDTPTVGFAVGGMVDMAEASSAVTVRYPDTSGLADAARRVLDDGAERARLVEAARARVEARHSIDVLGPRFLDGCLALLAGERTRR
jgi:glycosyltransferase involved in cell wall biosynthesis